MMAEQAMINISALPWGVKKPRGLSDTEEIHTLWRYLGPNWLSCSSQNDLLEILRVQLSGDTRLKKFHVEGTRLSDKIIDIYTKRDTIQYLEDPSLKWVRTIANNLIKERATLVTVVNLTKVDGNPHWIPLGLAADMEPVLFYGDSLGSDPPPELMKAFTWWLEQHNICNTVNASADGLPIVASNLLNVQPIGIASQTDGHACGVLADNAISHFVDPIRYPLISGFPGDVIDQRLRLFNTVAAKIICRVS